MVAKLDTTQYLFILFLRIQQSVQLYDEVIYNWQNDYWNIMLQIQMRIINHLKWAKFQVM
jgi:hypothetical protein